jgi:hypothetical protein
MSSVPGRFAVHVVDDDDFGRSFGLVCDQSQLLAQRRPE